MRSLALMVLSLCVLSGGCEKGPPRKATFPVTGTVLVDGKPADQVAVRCVPVEGMDQADPTESAAFTNAEGKFAIATYMKGDGVPVGSYVLTFEWGQWNYISMQHGGPDKLKGKYTNPKTSASTFEVREGQPTDLGTIELKTQ